MTRTARVERQTSETKLVVELDLDGTGTSSISTGVGFYDHMLTALGEVVADQHLGGSGS